MLLCLSNRKRTSPWRSCAHQGCGSKPKAVKHHSATKLLHRQDVRYDKVLWRADILDAETLFMC